MTKISFNALRKPLTTAKAKVKKAPRPGKWEILSSTGKKGEGAKGTWFTRLTSSNGNVLNTNTGFNSVQGARKNINATITTGAISPIVVYKSKKV